MRKVQKEEGEQKKKEQSHSSLAPPSFNPSSCVFPLLESLRPRLSVSCQSYFFFESTPARTRPECEPRIGLEGMGRKGRRERGRNGRRRSGKKEERREKREREEEEKRKRKWRPRTLYGSGTLLQRYKLKLLLLHTCLGRNYPIFTLCSDIDSCRVA